MSKGEWVRNPEGPYYTNVTCRVIPEHQNCMKYGRPDTEYMYWKWKPLHCDLQIFDPLEFLETVKGKSMGFVGDSVARNQMQSLICLLSRVEYPIDVSNTKNDSFKRWKYTTYDFTLVALSTPYLVRSEEIQPIIQTGDRSTNLYLDECDMEWATQIEELDFVIISSGDWLLRPVMYYEDRQLIGGSGCLYNNVVNYPASYGYRNIFQTVFKKINTLKNFKGVTFLSTFTPSHYEGGDWNTGGKCVRRRPFKIDETRLGRVDTEFYSSQLQEFRLAKKEGEKRGLKFRILDTTKAMLLRPDGHPSIYGHWPNDDVKLPNDCANWCLPGPIDMWNDLLLEMLKREAK